jgi:uncharacterized protein (TIGR03067 family)
MSPLLVGLALTIGAPNLKEPPPMGPPLVGRWECTALTISGKADLEWKGQEWEFTAEGGWVVYRDGKDIGGISRTNKARTYKADPKAGIGDIDLCERTDGVAQPALFKVDRDTLDLSIRFTDGTRPADFEPGDGLMTYTFRRVKAKD